MSESLTPETEVHPPQRFGRRLPAWLPWLPPLAVEDLTAHQLDCLRERQLKWDYFLILVRDPEALRERTKTDEDIFHNPDGGLSRGERELAATAASRLNGCHFCAAAHATNATTLTKRGDDVARLLDEGVEVRIDDRWDAIVDAAVALTRTPSAFGRTEVERLRAVGMDDDEVLDVVLSSAFFNWANRLMLALGEPSES